MSYATPAYSEPKIDLALPGFESIKRYWDRQRNCIAAKLLPGEFYVTKNRELITTVLGSCVSACIRDPDFAIGGMNHFMLPANGDTRVLNVADYRSEAARYGNYAMEQLINEILKHGGRREALEVKVFGGGRVIQHMTHSDIGGRNIDFVRKYIVSEGLTIAAQDLGDIYPRKVVYDPFTGKVQVKKLRSMHNDTIVERETGYLKVLQEEPVSGDIELFD
jgi:chemotaxis protein CheD